MKSEIIKGKLVQLRVAGEQDAEFTLSVRQNKEKNKYIPRIEVSIENQKKWIRNQEECDDSIFFVVERLNGERIGTYSLYNIVGDRAEAGRLVMLGNQVETIETGMLFSDYCFDVLKIKEVKSIIVDENMAALGFSNNLGGVKVDEYIDENTGRRNIVHISNKERYYEKRGKLTKLVEHFCNR